MPTKNFEDSITFYEHQELNGTITWLPLVEVTLIKPDTARITLSLIFDTGASCTTLRNDLYPLLGLTSWDQGQARQTATGNGIATVYQYNDITFEIFGKVITCPVNLMPIPSHPLYHGLLGRDTIFNEFGFGFWESTHELLVTGNP